MLQPFDLMVSLTMADNLDGLDQFIRTREDVARAFVNGQLAPLLNIVTRASPATFFGPDGDSVQGGIPVLSRYERDACLFESGSTDIEVLHMGASGDYAFWVGFQRAKVRLSKSQETVSFNLRVTELFRKEGHEWKLIHRHADPRREI